MKVSIALHIFLLSLICCGAAQAGAMTDNDDFVKTAFVRTIDSLMTDFQDRQSLNLDFKCSDCPRDFYLNILTSILKQKVSDLYIDNREKQIPKLEVTLSGSGFYFEKEGGSIIARISPTITIPSTNMGRSGEKLVMSSTSDTSKSCTMTGVSMRTMNRSARLSVFSSKRRLLTAI